MKKLLNILGYISLLIIPIFLLFANLSFYIPIKIVVYIGLVILLTINILHYKKTKIRDYGIRVLITVILLIVYTFAVNTVYGIIKNFQLHKTIDKISKIEFGNSTLNQDDLKQINFKFLKNKFVLTKGSFNAIITYNDGTTENTTMGMSTPNSYIIKLNNVKYFFNYY